MDHAENNSKPLSHVSYTLKPSPREWIASRNSRECRTVSGSTQRSTERVCLVFLTSSSYIISIRNLFSLVPSEIIRWQSEIDDEEENKEEHSSFTHDHPVPKTPTDTPPENNKAVGVVPREFPTKGESPPTTEYEEMS
jgi:hypothetical protein